MRGDMTRTVHNAAERSGATRRSFLGAAGIIAGTALIGEAHEAPTTAPAKNSRAASRPTTALGTLSTLKSTPPPNSLKGHPHNHRPTCVAAVSPLPPASGQYAVTCDDDGHVIHWNLSDPAHPKIVGNKPFDGIADNPKLSFVTVSPILSGDATVLAAGFDGYVWILSLKNRQLTGAQQFKDHQGSEVWAVAISPNGQQAVSSTNSGEIRVWDVGSASTLASTTPIGEPVNSLALIPSDAAGNINLFLAGFGNGQMYVMHYDSSKNIITYVDPPFDHGDAMPVNSIAVFKDPTAVTTVYKAITGSFDSIVRIWDLTQPGKAPTTFPTTVMHSHFIWRVAASGDGNTFASVGEDKRLYIFDASGNLKTPTNNPPQFSDGIMGVAFLDNSSLVATTNEWDGVLGRSEVVVVKF